MCEGLGHPRSKIHQREVSEKAKRERERQLDRNIHVREREVEREREREAAIAPVSDQIKQRGKEEGFKSICNNVQRCL